MNNKKDIMQLLEEAGYSREEMFHHESDLYVFNTPLTTRVIREWMQENGYRPVAPYFSRFVDQTTGKPMYDLAFQYTPWWEEHMPSPRA